ncbi:hypothetical protein GOP47_0001682 [Adiantum capillus-veneris]|uniref:NADH dehydrogenase [ubiquinone] 1 beta subcomplex subunit 9 n=1 Tax=Adiantum capillus-veneris TaxID=13818 RepID=A0A9D4ZNH8_ADICA|nr:hypothetical protein GOP47_0001682 [Adiantum capillus-veneris]
MNAATAAIAAYRAQQRQRVRLLYRQALKHTRDHCVIRNLFYIEADKRRAEFEAHRDEVDIDAIDRLIGRGEARLEKQKHPDPYIIPWAVGGTKWERNPPIPEEVEIVFDFGRETYDV